MANPYENADPFKEPPPPVPPPVYGTGGSKPASPLNTAGVATVYSGPTAPLANPQTTYETVGSPPMTEFVSIGESNNASSPSFYTAAFPQSPLPAMSATMPPGSPAPRPPPQETREPSSPIIPTSKFWTIQFYQQFFDVDTRLVLLRMSNTLVPINPPDFLTDRDWSSSGSAAQQQQREFELQEAGVTLARKADLYGPFWICTTLWMTLGIVSNIMSKISFSHQATSSSTKWSYDFTMASVACIVIYLYCFGIGCLVWGLMKYNALPVTLVDTLCLYGYSMFIFILVAILCMIPVSAVQWGVVMVGGAWSTAFLLINFWNIWKIMLQRSWLLGLMLFVGALHMLLTMSFKFYFMNYKF